MKKLSILLLTLTGIFFTSCVAVEPYEQVNINDPDMKLQAHKACKFVTAFQVYREGASGANGGKSGGGCGCN